jgi:RNA polymerase sigma-70 factor (ECF subfamily)
VSEILPVPVPETSRATRYDDAVRDYGRALDRLARSYEADSDRRQDLLQDIHLALWRSFERFDGRCSLRTWTYRVAHNVGASHVLRDRRARLDRLVSLEDVPELPIGSGEEHAGYDHFDLEWLARMLHQLKPTDRQLMLLYLEGLEASAIAEIVGVSAANVATKVHRIKKLLAHHASFGVRHDS